MRAKKYVILILFFISATATVRAQSCNGQIMEPWLPVSKQSKGCAPFNFQIRLTYYQSVPGTIYYVDWGDGSGVQTFTQTVAGPNGRNISHVYPNTSQNCFYQVTVDAENSCNPRRSVPVEPIFVTVWTIDAISIDPGVFRVCQGYATSLRFTDNSDWNCFPHPNPVRENSEARWIQWIYGTGSAANRISGIEVNGVTPIAPLHKHQGNFYQLDVGNYFQYEPVVVGLWYRGIPVLQNQDDNVSHDAVVVILVFQLPKVELTYSYDLTVSELGPISGGAHELALRFKVELATQTKSRKKQRYIPYPTFSKD